MKTTELELCPDCGVRLPRIDGPTHRYIGASPSCWAMFSALVNGGEPPIAPAPLTALISDAYAAQHPGVPSPQAIQSVAVHLLTLHGVLERSVAPANALWIRQRALRQNKSAKHDRFEWLTPSSLHGGLTVADIVHAPTPAARGEKAGDYVRHVWEVWSRRHRATIAGWYDTYVVPDRI